MSHDATIAEPADRDAARGRLARLAPWLLAGWAAGQWLVGSVSINHAGLAVALTVVSWLVFTALLLLGVAALCALDWPRWAQALMLLVGGLGWWALIYRLDLPDGPADRAVGIVAGLFMMVGTVGLGRAFSWLLREPSLLPPALLLAGIVDLWGVTYGFTAKVAQTNMETIRQASAAVPAVTSGAPSSFALPDLSIGPGDIVVAALVLAIVLREGFDLKQNLLWMYGLVLAGLALVLVTGWLVPGLVFLGLAGIIANRRHYRYTRDERRALLIATALVLALVFVGSLVLPGGG